MSTRLEKDDVPMPLALTGYGATTSSSPRAALTSALGDAAPITPTPA